VSEFDLAPDEEPVFAELLAGLHDSGYRDVVQHGELRPGARIRHVGHQWPAAYTDGTGVVLAIVEKPASSWSQTYGAPDIELIALWDEPQLGTRLSQLAQYHVDVVGSA
jgi:hypothetical protein